MAIGALHMQAPTNLAEHGTAQHGARLQSFASIDKDSLCASQSPISTLGDSPIEELKKDHEKSGIRPLYHSDSVASVNQDSSFENGRSWQTTFLRYGPLGGIACMFLAAASMIVSLAILLGSNGQPVSVWGATPSAILAICTAVANQSLRVAAFQGFVVMWWCSASYGTSLRQLHLSWRAGTTFAGALMAGRHMGLIGLACIVSTLVTVDGPLLQKATTVVNAPIVNDPVTLNVSMAPEVPRGYTGGWLYTNFSQTAAWAFNETMPTANGEVSNNISTYFDLDELSIAWLQPWIEDRTVPGIVQGCEGICTAAIEAPAFAQTACSRRQIPVNYSMPGGLKNMNNPTLAAPLYRTGFMVSGNLVLGEHETLTLITIYSNVESNTCVGEMYMDICTLASAIGEYEVTINNGVVLLNDGLPRIVALANNTQVDHGFNQNQAYHPSTLGGMWSYFTTQYASVVTYYYYQGSVVETQSGPMTPESHVIPGANNPKCVSYSDPSMDMLKSLNRLMFNIGAGAAQQQLADSALDPGLLVNTTTMGYRKGHRNVFQTDLRWFAAAAAVEGLCVALILPTYFGYWRLGRKVSFSPLEIAKAFEAPMFSGCNSNSSGRDIADLVGDVQAQYGATRSPLGRTKLAFGDPGVVQHPMKNSRFDD